MAPSFDVITNNMLSHPPPIVWRLGHAGNEDALVRSRLNCPNFETEEEFQHAKSQHLNWHNNKSTPFLSTFINKSSAEMWGRKLLEKGGDVWIYPVKTNGLIVFPTTSDELLILGGIPNSNIGMKEQIHSIINKADLMFDEASDMNFAEGEAVLADTNSLCYGNTCGVGGLVHNERTGLEYRPDDDAGVEEDEDWLDYAEYQMDH
ncbi:uncharacterized protein PHALS_14303 [Plasmopara halstedii]|uniref:Uncharacterized protein n=1 Tax=Plasmopara halstedii TaxID=4781 RepID=A0A0P1ATL7_PLAHL|nr:uncharacterized protein PHALS_14303 [Plasmopara halstedii]CEG44033.1 hypothetical protein PHALS_14303 [Plasmopara halstedii]|eukprot:XP_024580402.1 hypothetical protein PHALS_14303 [Plasmopara halstedii]